MTAKQLATAQARLGLNTRQLSEALGVTSKSRVSEWLAGRRPVPLYIAKHVETLLLLHKNWITAPRDHSVPVAALTPEHERGGCP